MYFEVDEVKRRYKQMWFKDNVSNWTTAPDNQLSWNYKRGLFAGVIGNWLQSSYTHYLIHMNALLKKYEHPLGSKQFFIFFKSVFSLESFKTGMPSRNQYSFALSLFHTGPFLAMARYLNAGWSANAEFVEISYYRKIPTTALAALITAPLGVAVEMIHRAYHADLSFPPQLRKGYKSYFDAMFKIPFNEGPYYLFKNTFPLFSKYFLGSGLAFYAFDFWLDKLGYLEYVWLIPHNITVCTSAAIAAMAAAVVTHPLTNVLRQFVDYDFKMGGDTYGGDYRKAVSRIWFADDQKVLIGLYKTHVWYYSPQWFFSLIIAEHLGLFRYWRVPIYGGAGDNTSNGFVM